MVILKGAKSQGSVYAESKTMQYIDSHAHLSSAEELPSIASVMARAERAKVTHVLNICTDPKTLEDGIDLQARYPCLKNAGATTPHDVEKEGEAAFPIFERAARAKQICAIGETGLDYHYQYSDKTIQKKFLIRYLHLAAKVQMPVIFHCREAFEDLFSIADLEYPRGSAAVLHCFTGSGQEAEEVLRRGWYLSLSGIITFKKSEALRDVAKIVPLSQLVIETDTPYLAPQSHRGKMNEPSFLPEIAECIAKVKGIDVAEVARASYENAKKLFFS
jgi:TatD DNase family protein